MSEFKFFIRHEMPGDIEPSYRGIPYHSEDMARAAFCAAVRNWGADYDVDLTDADGNLIEHHSRLCAPPSPQETGSDR